MKISFKTVLILCLFLLPCLSMENFEEERLQVKSIKEASQIFLTYLNDPLKNCTFKLKENELKEKYLHLEFSNKIATENAIDSYSKGNLIKETAKADKGEKEFPYKNDEGLYLFIVFIETGMGPQSFRYQKEINKLKSTNVVFSFKAAANNFLEKETGSVNLTKSHSSKTKPVNKHFRSNSLLSRFPTLSKSHGSAPRTENLLSGSKSGKPIN